jgi:hypothetical protein
LVRSVAILPASKLGRVSSGSLFNFLEVTFFHNLNVHQQRDPTAWTDERGIYQSIDEMTPAT